MGSSAQGDVLANRSFCNSKQVNRGLNLLENSGSGMLQKGGYGGDGTADIFSSFLDKAKNFGLEGLAKGSEFVGEAGSILRPGETPLTMKNVINSSRYTFLYGYR